MRVLNFLFCVSLAKTLNTECIADENCDEIEKEYYGRYNKRTILWLGAFPVQGHVVVPPKESVLILKTNFIGGIGPITEDVMEAAVVADGKGNAREAKFTFQNNTMFHHSCSMTHLGQFYIVGGNMGDHAKQMRKCLNQASRDGLHVVDWMGVQSTDGCLSLSRLDLNFEKCNKGLSNGTCGRSSIRFQLWFVWIFCWP